MYHFPNCSKQYILITLLHTKTNIQQGQVSLILKEPKQSVLLVLLPTREFQKYVFYGELLKCIVYISRDTATLCVYEFHLDMDAICYVYLVIFKKLIMSYKKFTRNILSIQTQFTGVIPSTHFRKKKLTKKHIYTLNEMKKVAYKLHISISIYMFHFLIGTGCLQIYAKPVKSLCKQVIRLLNLFPLENMNQTGLRNFSCQLYHKCSPNQSCTPTSTIV